MISEQGLALAREIEAVCSRMLARERERVSEVIRHVGLNPRLGPEDNACWLAWLIRYHVLGKDIE